MAAVSETVGTSSRSRAAGAIDVMMRRPVATVAAAGIATAAVNLAWASEHRGFGTLNIDETVVTARTYRLGNELAAGHLDHFTSALNGYEPLLPLLTSPWFALGADHPTTPLVVQVLLALVCAVGTAAIVQRVTRNPAITIVAGVVAATMPQALHATRTYHFGLGASASLVVALWALVASDRGRNRAAMVAFGAAVGCMVIARSMMIGFVPGVLAAALVQVEHSRRGARNGLVALAAALVVAGPWWVANWRSRWSYLMEYGYGERSANIGHEPSLLLGPFSKAVDLLPSFGPLVTLCGVAVVITMLRRGGLDRLRRPLTTRRRDAVAALVVVVGGYLALSTTINHGLYFTLPLAYPLIVVVAAAATQVPGRLRRRSGAIALGAGAVALVLSLAGPMPSDGLGAGLWSLADPLGNENAASTGDERLDARWWSANLQTISTVQRSVPAGRLVNHLIVGHGSERMNSGTLGLAVRANQPVHRAVFSGLSGTDPVDVWQRHLRHDPAGAATVVIVVETRSGSLGTPVDMSPFLRFAADAGWTDEQRLALPDGGSVTILTDERAMGST